MKLLTSRGELVIIFQLTMIIHIHLTVCNINKCSLTEGHIILDYNYPDLDFKGRIIKLIKCGMSNNSINKVIDFLRRCVNFFNNLDSSFSQNSRVFMRKYKQKDTIIIILIETLLR